MFDDKVALVTGAARGLGFDVSQRMAHKGARVVIADLDEQGRTARLLVDLIARLFAPAGTGFRVEAA